MDIINRIVDGYHDLMDNKSDQRVKDWFLMSSPFPTLCICLTYVFVVKVIGPQFMKNRKPFDLTRVLIWYNLFQVVFSAWLFYESIVSGWFWSHSFRCQPVDYSRTPHAMRFFFVLRKKFDHVSKLHVIHHGIMPMSVWFGVKFTPGGHSTFFGMLNTFVHIVMYSYYLLAALGPKVQKYLWWKKYITVIQMIQFVLVFLHAFQLLFIDCDYPRAFVWWIGMHAVLFYYLFSDFYKQAYLKKAKRAKAAENLIAETKSDSKDRGLPLLNGFSNGSTLGDVRQRVAGAVASQ
ncbi:unnamed protein product [Pieris brassicae]|uniref:Elongation of very long chain fatty acids protein n=1 Tax=Pieris brassicae TaxID=7116 RepID=A0A9P0SAV2_PIEBR|nr:unnamed protein product [Pieris brassicae]